MTAHSRKAVWIAITAAGNLLAWLYLIGVFEPRLYVVGDSLAVVVMMSLAQWALLGDRVSAFMWIGTTMAGSTLIYMVSGFGLAGGPLVSIVAAVLFGWIQARLWRLAWGGPGGSDPAIQRCFRNVVIAHLLAVVLMWAFALLALPVLRNMNVLVPSDAGLYVFAVADALLIAVATSGLAARRTRYREVLTPDLTS